RFSPGDPGRFRPIVDDLRNFDHFMVTIDFAAYWQAQRAIDTVFADPARWSPMAAANAIRMAWFSSDRTIREYAEEIWRCPV
ncbi:MAG: glycogen/starch/alpha-glucan phosphorylase, partial [Geminicoccaceae bacterium]|nr:glycogen/starch/alpha-glucan phosphorylase [Geminicoccaceae bacterium]